MGEDRNEKHKALRRLRNKAHVTTAAELLARRRQEAGKSPPQAESPKQPTGLVEACSGKEQSFGPWKCHLVRRTLSQIEPQLLGVAREYAAVMRGARQRLDELAASRELCIASDARGEDLLFLSLAARAKEQGVFLAGMMTFTGEEFLFEQALARSDREEPAVLQAVFDRLAGVSLVVTYDTRPGDLARLGRRAAAWPVHKPDRMPPNLNLRREIRRQWKGRLKTFSLHVLEQFVFGRKRPASLGRTGAARIYTHFLETGDAAGLARIFESNRHDLLTMAQLLCAALTGYEPPLD